MKDDTTETFDLKDSLHCRWNRINLFY